MLRKIGFVCGLMVVSARLASAQTCTIATTAALPQSCSVAATVAMNMPSLLQLTMDFGGGTETTLSTPAAVSEYTAATLTKDNNGPTYTVKANRGWQLSVKAATATFTTNPGYAKPCGDVAWAIGANAYAPLATTDASIASGTATLGTTLETIKYRTTYDITKDIPGQYRMSVTFTLAAQ